MCKHCAAIAIKFYRLRLTKYMYASMCVCVASKRRKIVIANLYNASGTGSDIFSYNTGHRNSTNIQHDHIDRYNIENHPQKRNARLLYI